MWFELSAVVRLHTHKHTCVSGCHTHTHTYIMCVCVSGCRFTCLLLLLLADDDGGPRQLEACWMREVVEPGECVHGSDYELFTVNGSDHERPPPLLSQL